MLSMGRRVDASLHAERLERELLEGTERGVCSCGVGGRPEASFARLVGGACVNQPKKSIVGAEFVGRTGFPCAVQVGCRAVAALRCGLGGVLIGGIQNFQRGPQRAAVASRAARQSGGTQIGKHKSNTPDRPDERVSGWCVRRPRPLTNDGTYVIADSRRFLR